MHLDELETPRSGKITLAFSIASYLVIAVTLVTAVVHLALPELALEPVLGFLGVVYIAVPLLGKLVIALLGRAIEQERLSVGYMLAYGYLNNYLHPVVSRLRKESADPEGLRFFVYIPRSLVDLQRDAIDDLLGELGHAYRIDKVELDFPGEKRGKDFRTARRIGNGNDAEGPVIYFDFPTTLLTVEAAVDYKLESREGRFSQPERERLGKRYIANFREQLSGMLNSSDKYRHVRGNIRLVEGGMDFLDKAPQDDDSR